MVVAEGPGLTIGQQAAHARAKFPELVRDSVFTYWEPASPIAKTPLRLLVGVSPTFAMQDLRLLDLIQEKASPVLPKGLQVDVFDLDDMGDWSSAAKYFPGIDHMVPNPIVGVWTLNYHLVNFWGGKAVDYLLLTFDLNITGTQLAQSVSPPSDDMLD